MVANRLNFEESKLILKCSWKYKNAVELQIQYRRMFQKETLTQVTTTGIKDQFEADGNDQSVNEKGSARQRTSTRPTKEERGLETFHVWWWLWLSEILMGLKFRPNCLDSKQLGVDTLGAYVHTRGGGGWAALQCKLHAACEQMLYDSSKEFW